MMFWVQIKSTYYLDVEKLLKKVTGASRVHIFDHTLRKGTIRDSKYAVPSLALTTLTQCFLDLNMDKEAIFYQIAMCFACILITFFLHCTAGLEWQPLQAGASLCHERMLTTL